MPVLDLQMYVGKDGLVKYEFYKKPCASQLTIPARSAHIKQQKLSVMVEEGLWRLCVTIPEGWSGTREMYAWRPALGNYRRVDILKFSDTRL